MNIIYKYFIYKGLPIQKPVLDNSGFAMIAALLAILILTAVGMLVFTVTTRDIRISTRITGEKKALAAAEAGIHDLVNRSNTNAGNIATYAPANVIVNAATDPDSEYTITTSPITGIPGTLPVAGFEIGGSSSKSWGQTVSNKRVTGRNTRYNSNAEIDVGIGYGPIEISTGQPAAGG